MKERTRKKRHFWRKLCIVIVIGLVIGVVKEIYLTPTVDQKEVNEVFQRDTDYQYFYLKSDNQDKEIYQRIYYTLSFQNEEITLQTIDIDNVKNIFLSVLYDHPEFYYASGEFQYQQYQEQIHFMPTYTYKKEDVEKMDKRITAKISTLLSQAKEKKSDIERAKLAYEFVVKGVQYQDDSQDNQNIISSLVNGQSVCAGYARAYQYLLNKMDVKCTYIVGTANESNGQTLSGDGHAWTMVVINDDYYYCDPTWGDVSAEGMSHTCYGYFMMNSEEMLKHYKPEVVYEKTKKQEYNYFKENSCYLDEYNEEIMSHAVKLGLEKKTRVAEIKCANDDIYKKVKLRLESSYLGYRILKQNNCWSESSTYTCVDELRLVELYY